MQKRDEKITKIKGIGKAAEKDFSSLGITTYYDLVSFVPRSYEDRRSEKRLRDATGEDNTVYCKITVLKKDFIPTKKGRTLKVRAEDENGDEIDLYCFNRDYLDKTLYIGHSYFISASVSKNRSLYMAAAFEIKRSPRELDLGKIIPLYSLSGNLKEKTVRFAVDEALKALSPMEDELKKETYERLGLLHHSSAYYLVHHPNNFEDVQRALRTLSFTELFYMALKSAREKTYEEVKKVHPSISNLEKKLIKNLTFSLTEDQEKALDEIRSDLDRKDPMNRLLEGDVGSGKTLVAWLSALHVIAKGEQVAFMAPTELLAKQHAENAARLLEPLGVRLCYLTGSIKSKSRPLLLNALKEGEVDLAIGTHALFTEDVTFKKLTYVIIDEQHRFGVEQRNALLEKAKRPNVLSMTATPIPRTLALTFYSNLDLSEIKHKPDGRKEIKTFLVSSKKREEMLNAIEVEFKRGHQAYFVYPRIEGDDEGSLKAVEIMYEELKERYPEYKSAAVHSRMKDEEKIDALNKFRDGEYQYLVATSVIEVGIDVPNATCIIIEHADRFGLSALHQLRGRVGRSSLPSYCFLVFSDNITDDAKERLKVMKSTNDGFKIAEKDLEIRGPGDITGFKQSGYLKMRFASITKDQDLLLLAKDEAERIAKDDKGLIKAENSILRKYIDIYAKIIR